MNSNRVQCPKDVTCTTVDETSPIALIDVESETHRFPLGHSSFEHLNSVGSKIAMRRVPTGRFRNSTAPI